MDLGHYKPAMMCLQNDKDLYINGNYDTESASAIMVVLERCDPEKNAQS